MASGTALVVRFSSLGDVLLAAHLPSYLRQEDPERRVLFATKERYAGILRGHPDVARFYLLEDGSFDPAAPAPFGVVGSLGDLIAAIRREEVALAFDLQQNLRSARLIGALDRSKRIAPAKHGLRRRLMVFAKWLHPEPLRPLLHTYRLLAGLDPETASRPWLREALSDAERARARARLGKNADRATLLGVGARWETKRWPIEHFVALGALLESEFGLRPWYAVGPGEPKTTSALRALLPADRQSDVLEMGFREVGAVASFARVIVSNDSAILHLGPALGVPTVGIFGSTVPAFGFAPSGPRDAVAEIALGCRPCGVHGRTRCPLGHHRCMRDLAPVRVLAAVERVLAAAESAA